MKGEGRGGERAVDISFDIYRVFVFTVFRMKRFVSLRTANHWHSCVTIARFVLLKQELWLRQSVKVNRRKRSWFTFRIACRESEMQREIERVSCFARCGIHQDILPISSSRAYHALVGLASCMHVH